jgi:hypothetical protein
MLARMEVGGSGKGRKLSLGSENPFGDHGVNANLIPLTEHLKAVGYRRSMRFFLARGEES